MSKEKGISVKQYLTGLGVFAFVGLVCGFGLAGGFNHNSTPELLDESNPGNITFSVPDFSGASWECVHESITDWKFFDNSEYFTFNSQTKEDVLSAGGTCYLDKNEVGWCPIARYDANLGYYVADCLPTEYCIVGKIPNKECDKWQLVKIKDKEPKIWVS